MTTTQYPVRFPQGVTDEEARVAFVSRRAGGIAAIDLEAGKVLWTTTESARPLLVLGDRLLAYRPLSPSTLQVVAGAADGGGKLTALSTPITFPEWVDIDPPDSSEFSLKATVEGDCLLLAWEAHAYYRGGAAPSRRVLQQTRRDAAGLVRIDLGTGQATMLPGEPAAPAAAPAASSDATARVEPTAQDRWQFGSYLYALAEEQTADSLRRSILKKWQAASGKLLWELVLDEWRPSRAPPRRV